MKINCINNTNGSFRVTQKGNQFKNTGRFARPVLATMIGVAAILGGTTQCCKKPAKQEFQKEQAANINRQDSIQLLINERYNVHVK